MYAPADQDRFIAENSKLQDNGRGSKNRSEFARDRARIIHSSAFRRLAGKTQVLTSGHDDFVRTRLTHSLEVAQIGRQIAENLGTDSDLVEAACLAHDLGHPPFGHHGESVLNEVAGSIGGFEGNAQTFRILTRLEPKFFSDSLTSVGLNLSRATLDGTIKYPWGEAQKNLHAVDSQNSKYNFYQDDQAIFNWVREPVGKTNAKSIETQIMDFADDVSYSVHDFEDGYSEGLIIYEALNNVSQSEVLLNQVYSIYNHDFSESEFEEAFLRLRDGEYFSVQFDGSFEALATLKSITSSLIGRFVTAVTENTQSIYPDTELIRYQADLKVPRDTWAEITLLKSLDYGLIMENETVINTRESQRKIIKDLVDYFMSASPRPAEQMSHSLGFFWDQAQNDDQRLRVAIDQVASLTDTSALRLQFIKPVR